MRICYDVALIRGIAIMNVEEIAALGIAHIVFANIIDEPTVLSQAVMR